MKLIRAGMWMLVLLQVGCTTSTATPAPLPIATFPVIQPTPETIQQSIGGEPRSPGYWLIWNTCAEGNQSETARTNGGREAGWIVMEDVLADHGILIGALAVESCEQGVNILQVRDMQGIEMKNDVAYGLAAQLLAARLNLSVGSEYCPASDQAVAEAQLLLVELNFDGTGIYLGPPRSDDNVEAARKLTEQLTNYNIGALCVP